MPDRPEGGGAVDRAIPKPEHSIEERKERVARPDENLSEESASTMPRARLV